ncbi:MAG TPA: glutamate mutase L [Ktedonobacterales bacterium]
MPASSTVRTLLVVDCGSAFTKAALLAQVDGQFRLLAATQVPTTEAPPHADLTHGIAAAIADLERIHGRPLRHDGQMIKASANHPDGVDGVSLVMSAGGPVRLLTTGPGHQALAALVRKGASGLFAALEPFPDVAPPRRWGSSREWAQEVERISALQPHGVVVVGNSAAGQHGRADLTQTARTIAAYIDALNADLPERTAAPAIPVIFTGSRDDADDLQQALARRVTVRGIDSLAPGSLGQLNQAIANLYENKVLRAIPGYESARALATVPPVSVATSLTGVMRYLGQRYQMNVIGVDVGASSTVVVGATAQGGFVPCVLPELGVGPGAGAIVRRVGAANVLRWLLEPVSEGQLRDYVLGRMIRPGLIPSSARELEIEHALAREAILCAATAPDGALEGLRPVDVILGTGGVFAHVAQPEQAALILLDALQPRGITSLVLDVAQITSMLGGVAGINPTVAGEVAEGDAVSARLGSVVSTSGATSYGQAAVRVSLEYADGRRSIVEVMPGTMVRLPLGPGERGMLSLLPAPMVDIGLGPGQQARASDALEGGLVGLVIDARGRPLSLPAELEKRQAKLREWHQALGINY